MRYKYLLVLMDASFFPFFLLFLPNLVFLLDSSESLISIEFSSGLFDPFSSISNREIVSACISSAKLDEFGLANSKFFMSHTSHSIGIRKNQLKMRDFLFSKQITKDKSNKEYPA